MRIISVKYPTDNKVVDFKIKEDIDAKLNDLALIDNSQVKEIAQVINIYEADKLKNQQGEGIVTKIIDGEDVKKLVKIKRNAIEFIPKASEIVAIYDLPMSIVDADLSYDEKKLTIYFSSDTRIDFRKLVSHFVRTFKKLIRLQQIGPREQAQKLGGYGKCGEEVCCRRFLGQLENVSIELAKNQCLAEVSSNKINGNCGKLLCCLKYENDLYSERKKDMPKIGDEIKTKEGIGRVIKLNILKNSVLLELNNANKDKVEVKL